MSGDVTHEEVKQPESSAWSLNELIYAVYRGDVTKVTELLKHPNCDINERLSNLSPLVPAASSDPPHAPEMHSILLPHDPRAASGSGDDERTVLMHAAGSHSPQAPEIVTLLLQHDPKAATVSNEDGRTGLMHAAISDSPYAPEIVSLLLQRDPTVATMSDKNGLTVLMYATHSASTRVLEIVSILLQHDSTVATMSDKNGLTVLMYATNSDSPNTPEIVSLLLKHDPTVATMSDKNGLTVLMYATSSASTRVLEIVSVLLQHDPKSATVSDENGTTVLMQAAMSNSPNASKIVGILLEQYPAAATMSDKNGLTVLMHATRSHSPHALGIVNLLLLYDPSAANAIDADERTVLMHAAESHSHHAPEIVSVLLKYYPKAATLSDADGETVLMHAMDSHSPRALDIVKLLLQHDPNATSLSDKVGWTVLMHATESDSPRAPDIVRLLLHHDPSASAVIDADGMTVLIHAAKSDSPHSLSIVNMLLYHDPSAAAVRDADGWTVLMHATQSDSPRAPDIFRRLLQYDPSLATVRAEDGLTVLMIATHSASTYAPEIVSMLLQHDPNSATVSDEAGRTVLMHAVKSASHLAPEIIWRLLQHDPSTSIVSEMNKVEHYGYTKWLDRDGYSCLDHMLSNRNLHSQHLKPCSNGLKIFNMLSKYTTNNTLPLAIAHCSTELCEKLLNVNKELVNTSLPCGETVLHSAIGTKSVLKCRLVMKFNPDIKARWKGLLPLELALLNSCESEILESVSKEMRMSEIEVSIKKCLCNGESVLDLVHKVGIRRWRNYFETPKSYSDAANAHSSVTAETSKTQLGVNIWASWLNLRKHCSFKLRVQSPRNSKGTNNIKMNNNAVSVARHCRIIMKQNKGEVKQIQKCVTTLIQHVADTLSQQKSFMAFRCVPAGSMEENTKCYAPNEMDLICEFIDTVELQFEKERIRCAESSPWSKLSSINGYLDMRLVAQAFYDLVIDTIRLIRGDIASALDNIFISHYPLQRMDKISLLKLIWRGDSFPELTISVDLAPAFKHPSYSEQLPLTIECKEFYLLAKSSRHAYTPATSFHLSYCRAEQVIMKGLPPYIRHGYIFAKAIRIADIAGDSINLKELDVEEDIQTEEFVTSYILKNSLFNILQQPDIKESKEKCRYAWAEAIYDELEQSLKEKREITLWHDEHENLLDCEDCQDANACCQKRAIMLALVQQIRKWLEQNMEELRKD